MIHNVYCSNIITERINKHWCSKREHLYEVFANTFRTKTSYEGFYLTNSDSSVDIVFANTMSTELFAEWMSVIRGC